MTARSRRVRHPEPHATETPMTIAHDQRKQQRLTSNADSKPCLCSPRRQADAAQRDVAIRRHVGNERRPRAVGVVRAPAQSREGVRGNPQHGGALDARAGADGICRRTEDGIRPYTLTETLVCAERSSIQRLDEGSSRRSASRRAGPQTPPRREATLERGAVCRGEDYERDRDDEDRASVAVRAGERASASSASRSAIDPRRARRSPRTISGPRMRAATRPPAMQINAGKRSRNVVSPADPDSVSRSPRLIPTATASTAPSTTTSSRRMRERRPSRSSPLTTASRTTTAKTRPQPRTRAARS